MTNTLSNQYQPDCVSPPGETLKEALEEQGITQAELAEKIGIEQSVIQEIIQGKAEITPEIALQLQQVLLISSSFWNNRERRYREFLARQIELDKNQTKNNWLKFAGMYKDNPVFDEVISYIESERSQIDEELE